MEVIRGTNCIRSLEHTNLSQIAHRSCTCICICVVLTIYDCSTHCFQDLGAGRRSLFIVDFHYSADIKAIRMHRTTSTGNKSLRLKGCASSLKATMKLKRESEDEKEKNQLCLA